MLKKLRIIILALALIILSLIGLRLFYSQTNHNNSKTITPVQEQIKQVSLVINYGNGKVDSYQYSFTQEKTAYDVLKETAEKEKISLETKQYDFGIFVKSINKYSSSEKMAWIYFVNDQSAQVAADKYKLTNGDKIEWKYIEPQ